MSRAFLAALFLLFTASPVLAAKGDAVVLLHGIGRTKASMEEMAGEFQKNGYRVLNLDYKSRDYSITQLTDDIHAEIKAFNKGAKKKLHFVGYSMGGLVARAYIKRHRPRNLGRVVVMGSPNKGSEVADFMRDTLAYQSVYGPAGQELTTKQDYDRLLGKVTYELGSIAGDRSIDPVSSWVLINGTDDGKVSIESTKVKGMKDHIVLHAAHTFMMSNDEAIKQSHYFIEHGKFDHASNAGKK